MRKILTIAAREYRAMVGTKAFLISVTMMPVLMFGGVAAMELLKNVAEIKHQTIVVIDQSGRLFEPLRMAADSRNRFLDQSAKPPSAAERESPETDSGDNRDDDFNGFSQAERYLLERWEGDVINDVERWKLSERIRKGEVYAFVEIPPDVLDARLPTTPAEAAGLPRVRFYAEDSGFSEARTWLIAVINELVKVMRLEAAGIEVEKVQRASLPVGIRGLGLLERNSSGEIRPATEKNELIAIIVPLAVMMLMFMVIFMASQPMLESVLEEKSNRIAEVLLGSASPWQLMTGKLLGTVGGSMTILMIYLVGGWLVASYRGWTQYIPLDLVPWFLVFQVFGVLFFASIFMAVGASVTQLKEAQSMLMPVWLVMMSPMFVWLAIIRDPNGTLATWFSFFPPATPTMMPLRMSTDATIPTIQPIAGLIVLIAATVACVYIAARIFRVGLLWQGKTPRLGELLKWAFRG